MIHYFKRDREVKILEPLVSLRIPLFGGSIPDEVVDALSKIYEELPKAEMKCETYTVPEQRVTIRRYCGIFPLIKRESFEKPEFLHISILYPFLVRYYDIYNPLSQDIKKLMFKEKRDLVSQILESNGFEFDRRCFFMRRNFRYLHDKPLYALRPIPHSF